MVHGRDWSIPTSSPDGCLADLVVNRDPDDEMLTALDVGVESERSHALWPTSWIRHRDMPVATPGAGSARLPRQKIVFPWGTASSISTSSGTTKSRLSGWTSMAPGYPQ